MTESDIQRIVEALEANQTKVQDNGNRSADKTFSALMREVREEMKTKNQSDSFFQEKISGTLDSIHNRLCLVESWVSQKQIADSKAEGIQEGRKSTAVFGWKAITVISSVVVFLVQVLLNTFSR
jgi:hypothetical protein